MQYFKEGFGLVTENDPETENCNLFYAEYLTLKKQINQQDVDFFVNNMNLKRTSSGLFNRRSKEPTPTRTVSKDEILGFLVTSKICNTGHGKEIWKHLITHFGTYNNVQEWRGRMPFNLGNFYTWGQLVDSPLSYLFLVMFTINLIICSNKKPEDTSSKIMYWLIFQNLKETTLNKMLKKYFEKKMKAMYQEDYKKSLFNIYFHMESQENFPIFKELNKGEVC